MIKTAAQRARTLVQVEGFQRALALVDQSGSTKRDVALRASYQSMIRQLEDEVREYDRLTSGQFEMPVLERLDQVAPFVARLRLAKGVSQTELARRLGVSKQVISRHEEEDYQGVATAKLQDMLDALGVKARIVLSA